MQLARKSLQMHFDVHVCLLEKILLCSFDSKNFCKFCTIFGPQNGVEKWTQKWCQNLTSQNGVQKWHPKGRLNSLFLVIFWKSKYMAPFWVPFLDTILGGQILAPFLSPFFNSHFEVQKWCKICKSFCCQSCITIFFQQTNMHIKMHL